MLRKIIASVLITTLTFANLLVLGIYLGESITYAATDKMDFDAYFVDGSGNKVHGISEDMNIPEKLLNVELSVKNGGYLKDAKIEFIDSNFSILKNLEESNTLKQMNRTQGTIELKEINDGTTAIYEVSIAFPVKNEFNLANFNKGSIVKLTGTYVDKSGNESSIDEEVTINIEWKGVKPNSILEHEIVTYLPYEYNDEKGVLVQYKITSDIEGRKDSKPSLPIANSEIKMVIPELNGNAPTEVRVNADFTYEEETKELIITKENKDISGVVLVGYGKQDEYIVSCIYKEEAHVNFPITINTKVDIATTLYSNAEPITTEAESIKGNSIENSIGSFISYEMKNQNVRIDKGYMYYEGIAEYTSIWQANIHYADLSDSIIMESKTETFIDNNLNAFPMSGNSYYKETYINKNNFDYLFGEDGFIKIYDGEILIQIIDKDTESNASGNIVLKYDNTVSNIKIVTSKPIAEGNLEIRNIKAIAEINYNKDTIKSFQTMNIGMNDIISNVLLGETSTKASIEFTDNKLLTTKVNENVEINITLERYLPSQDLYKNPVLEIVFPSYVESVSVRDIGMLYADGLNLDKSQVVVEGTTIRIPLTGDQTTYAITENIGTQIVLRADIKIRDFTPTIDEAVSLYYTNEKANGYETEENSKGVTNTLVKIWGPSELVTKTKVEGTKIVTTVLNNFGYETTGINILGRFPFEGNKDILNLEDLGSTFTGIVKSNITIGRNNVEIYYSENAEATEDLTDVTNGWTKTTNLNSAKSYLVVFTDTMKVGELVSFSYEIEVPEEALVGEKAVSTSVMYYEGRYKEQLYKGVGKITLLGAGVVASTDVEIAIRSSVEENDIVHEGQVIRYEVSVTNNSDTDLTNVNVKAIIPDGATYVVFGEDGEEQGEYYVSNSARELDYNIPTILAGETKTINAYEIMIDELPEGVNTDTLESKVKVSAEEIATDVEKSFNNVVETAKFSLYLDRVAGGNYSLITKGEEIEYVIFVENITNSNLNNVIIENILPAEFTYISAYVEDDENAVVNYNSGLRLVSYEAGTMASGEMIKIRIKVKATDNSATAINYATVKADGINEHMSNPFLQYIKVPSLTITQTTNINTVMNEGEELEYIITVKNTGETAIQDVVVTNDIPVGSHFRNSIPYLGEPQNGQVKWEISMLQPGGEREFRFMVDVNGMTEATREITNVAKVSALGIDEKTSNSVTIIVEKTTNSGKSIYGYAWIDANKNGRKDEGEKALSNVGVILVDTTISPAPVVEDIDTGLEKSTYTGADGRYEFTNIQPGRYKVVFAYDTNLYELTTYQATGVEEYYNSDAKAMNSIENGQVVGTRGATDVIEITNSSKPHINIGLIEKPVFDLSLQKYVSKLKIETSNETKVIDYNNETLVKYDISQRYVEGAKVTIDYKITVKNEGEVPGYVKDIIDYLPTGVKLESNNWSGENGEIHNTELKDVAINPGETKTITLTISKKLTSNNVGLITNLAEIAEYENSEGLLDKNSTPGNKSATENDLGKAEVLIGIATGSAVIYVVITLIAIGTLAMGIYLINKKVLN